MNLLSHRAYLVSRSLLITLILLVETSFLHAADCDTLAAGIDTRHRQVLQQHQPGSDGFFSNLYAIEDSVFEIIKQCPDSAIIFATMGELQLTLGQPPLAQLYGAKAIRLNNRSWQGHYVLGSALNMRDEYAQGLEYLQAASDLQPDNYSLLLNLCSSLEKNKFYSKAITTCTQVIEKGPYEIRGTAYYLRSLARSGNEEQTLAEQDRQLAKELGFRR